MIRPLVNNKLVGGMSCYRYKLACLLQIARKQRPKAKKKKKGAKRQEDKPTTNLCLLPDSPVSIAERTTANNGAQKKYSPAGSTRAIHASGSLNTNRWRSSIAWDRDAPVPNSAAFADGAGLV